MPGDVLAMGRTASVQFAGDRALVFRVTVVCDEPTYDGWVWLTGYVLNTRWEATERRAVFVLLDGLRLLRPAPVDLPVRRPPRTGPPAQHGSGRSTRGRR